MSERNYKIDNIRCILIFSVVMGHLLEVIDGLWATNIYKIIYSFHMPGFIFITGYFANFRPKKIFLSLIYPYFLFQVLYILFYRAISNNPIELQFTQPHWLLWYLFVAAVYYCLIPLIKTERKEIRILILLLAAAVCLLAGKDNSIGYYLSLSRILTFLPFFVAGYYSGHGRSVDSNGIKLWDQFMNHRLLMIGLACTLAVFAICYVCSNPQISPEVFYGSYSYEAMGYNLAVRAGQLFIAICWLIFFWTVIPKRRVFILSSFGANTLSVYLLHGFLIYWIRTMNLFTYSERENILLAAGIALFMIALLGNKLIAVLFHYICTGNWMGHLYQFCFKRVEKKGSDSADE